MEIKECTTHSTTRKQIERTLQRGFKHNGYMYTDEEEGNVRFSQSKSGTNCKFEYGHNIPPDFQRLGNEWYGSVQEETIAHSLCDGKKSKKIVLKQGVNVIPIQKSCRIVGNSFSLPKFGIKGSESNEIKVIIPPSEVEPHIHIGIKEMPKIEATRVAKFSPQEIKQLSWENIVNPRSAVIHPRANTAGIVICVIFIVCFILFVKFRNRCYVMGRNNARRTWTERTTQPQTRNMHAQHRMSPTLFLQKITPMRRRDRLAPPEENAPQAPRITVTPPPEDRTPFRSQENKASMEELYLEQVRILIV